MQATAFGHCRHLLGKVGTCPGLGKDLGLQVELPSACNCLETSCLLDFQGRACLPFLLCMPAGARLPACPFLPYACQTTLYTLGGLHASHAGGTPSNMPAHVRGAWTH